MPNTESLSQALSKQIENEVTDYLTKDVQISDNHSYSQHKLVRRIELFENHIYPTGKFDKQKNYKFWFDIITSRVDSEVKNIDFDTNNVLVYSPRKIDELPVIITNLRLKEYLREQGQAEEINSAVEEGSAWGNVVWKKVSGGYERVDLRNFYVINQTAFSLQDSPVIERHQFSSSDLRAKKDVWHNIEVTLEDCKINAYSSSAEVQSSDTTVPYYLIFERNGEVSLKDLKEARGEEVSDGDKDKYVLAKIVASGTQTTGGTIEIRHILYADTIKKMPYKEYHRSRYKGTWFREGIIELLFDCQVRANQIGNQIAQGLAWSSKVFFRYTGNLLIQNILTGMSNGDTVKSADLQRVDVRMEGFDQLIADWNKNLNLANDIVNSREVVQGITPTSGTPLGTTQLLNQNSNKLFDFIREKLAIPFTEIFEQWIIPELVKDISAQDIVRLTGDSDMLLRLHEMIVNSWYIDNLLVIGVHTKEMADTIKQSKLEELKKRPQLLVSELQQVFKGFKPNVSVIITGENINLPAELQDLAGFIALETDPIRRTALIEMAMKKQGIDAGALPKTLPMRPMQQSVQGAQNNSAEQKVVQ